MGLFSSSKDGSVATQSSTDTAAMTMDGLSSSASSFVSNNPKHSPQFPVKWYGFVNKYNVKSMALRLGETKDNPLYSLSMPWAKHSGMFYSSTVSLPGGIKTDLKCSLGTSKFDFECPVGPDMRVEQFQWKGRKAGMSGKWTLTMLSTGETLAMYDEGKTGWSLPTAFEFTFEERALDGSLGDVFPVMAAFTGIRCWQSTKNIRYTTGTGVGSSVSAGMA